MYFVLGPTHPRQYGLSGVLRVTGFVDPTFSSETENKRLNTQNKIRKGVLISRKTESLIDYRITDSNDCIIVKNLKVVISNFVVFVVVYKCSPVLLTIVNV